MSQHDASGSTKSIRGDGMEIARHVFGKDWSMSPLGDMKDWPQNLKFATNLCLSSHMPIAVWWSSDFIIIYNDAFRSLMGLSDSGALGIGGSNVLPQIWKNLEPSLLATFKQSGPTQVEIEIASPRRGASTP